MAVVYDCCGCSSGTGGATGTGTGIGGGGQDPPGGSCECCEANTVPDCVNVTIDGLANNDEHFGNPQQWIQPNCFGCTDCNFYNNTHTLCNRRVNGSFNNVHGADDDCLWVHQFTNPPLGFGEHPAFSRPAPCVYYVLFFEIQPKGEDQCIPRIYFNDKGNNPGWSHIYWEGEVVDKPYNCCNFENLSFSCKKPGTEGPGADLSEPPCEVCGMMTGPHF